MRRKTAAWCIGLVGVWLVRGLALTWRVRVTGRFEVAPRIYTLPHGLLLLPAFRLRSSRAVVMISRHQDGEMIAQTVQRLGYPTVRGSSTRGAGAAVRDLLTRYADRPWVVTPDGPKGPRGSVKAGLIRLAQETGRTLQPLVGAARPAKHFASWDRFALPLPFARVVLHFGEPVAVPHDLPAEQCAEFARQFEQHLAAAEKAAQTELASW
jgi:lysophospholipid acyltransferase (LPLAT)-like uncharacterized protein